MVVHAERYALPFTHLILVFAVRDDAKVAKNLSICDLSLTLISKLIRLVVFDLFGSIARK